MIVNRSGQPLSRGRAGGPPSDGRSSDRDALATPGRRVAQALAAVRRRWPKQPRAALILGTGLGRVARLVQREAVIPYSDIPHFPRSTAVGHRGQLVCGELEGVPIITMEGRCHLYEGYRVDDVALPVRVLQAAGAELLIVSNASGGINPKMASGDILLVEDHIDFMWQQPNATGQAPASDRPARRAASPYDPQLIDQALAIARTAGFAAHRGVYVAVTGPNYETRAEYRFFRLIGGDVVGMSTVPEVTAAGQLGMRVLALSSVTNVARPDAPQVVSAQDVIQAAERAEPNLRQIVRGVLRSYAAQRSSQVAR